MASGDPEVPSLGKPSRLALARKGKRAAMRGSKRGCAVLSSSMRMLASCSIDVCTFNQGLHLWVFFVCVLFKLSILLLCKRQISPVWSGKACRS
jgi:hypothetical protein